MASRNFNDLQFLGKEIKLLSGAFKFAGSSNPSVTQGEGYTVVRASGGTYTLTLADSYTEIVSVFLSTERDDATTAVYDLNFKRASTSSSVITIQTYTDDGDGTGTVEDIAAGSNNGNWCHFLIVCRNTSVASTA